jgi:hypothetical protein
MHYDDRRYCRVATTNNASAKLRTAAVITNWSDATQTYSLGDIKDGNGGLIDMEQEMSWLAPGMYYTITNVSYAWETDVV